MPTGLVRPARRKQPRITARLWSASLVLLHACAHAQTAATDSTDLFQRAFGQRQRSAAQQIALPVSVDDREVGLIKAHIRGTHVELDRKELASLLKPLLQDRVLRQLLPGGGRSDRIALEDLRLLGLEANYSADRIALEIGVPLALRDIQPLSLKTRAEDADYNTPLRIRPQPWSFIGNLRWAMSMQDGNGTASQYGRLMMDAAGRWHEWVLEGNGTLGSMDSARSFSRQDLRLVRDWAPEAVRLTLGDVATIGQGGSSSLTLGGVHVARLFGLNPSLSTQSLPGATLALPKGATVDMSVNGLPANTLRLGPGVYKLSDLPVFAGANAVELTITEPGGQVSRRSFDYFFNASLLRPGLHEYDLALGYPVSFDGNGRSYDTRQRMMSAWWRRGWTDSLTAGISLQTRNSASLDARMQGLDAVWATLAGDFSGWLAQSRHGTFGGQAGSLQWRWVSSTQQDASRSWSASVQGSQYSEGFAPVTSDRPGPALRDVGLRLSLLWQGGWRGNLGSIRRNNISSGERSSETSLSLRHRIGPYWSAEATLAWRRLGQEQDRNIAFLLSRSGGNTDTDTRWQTTASIQSQDQRLQWDGAVSGRGAWLGSNTAWQMGANHSEALSGQASSAQMRALSGRLDSGLFLSENRSSSGNTRQVEATLAGAVVASADGGWNWSSPVTDSAVQFKPYKGYEEIKLLVDPQFDRAALTSDRFGTPPLANLSAYVPRELQLDFENLPAGRGIGMDRPVLAPAYRSVLVVPFGSNAQTQVRGLLLDSGGEPQPLQALLLFDSTGRKVTDLFTNRKGQFTSSQLAPGRYALKQPGNDAELASVQVQETDAGILDIGTVQIKGDEP